MILESLYRSFSYLIFYQNHFVMRAIEEKVNIYNELTPVEHSALHFKVVVNNYRQRVNERVEESVDEIVDATTIARHYGLPPQPAKYIKYPKYDWF